MRVGGVEITALTRRRAQDSIPVRWLCGDLQSPEDCDRLVEGQDVIIHLAHTDSPLTSDRDMVRDTMFNLVPTLNLLKAIQHAGRRPHVIFPSSGGAIYGKSSSHVPFKESDPPQPLSSYGIQKLVAEHYIRLSVLRGHLSATVLRIGNAYGWLLPLDRPQGFTGTAVARVLTGQPIRVFGNPANVRDYVHIDDICEAMLLSLTRRGGFEVFNIGTGVGTSVANVIALIEQEWGRPVSRVMVHHDHADFLPNWCVLDAEKARRELGWSGKIDIRRGIRLLIEQGKHDWLVLGEGRRVQRGDV
jgi:UDP-glucose 4-epimerase